MRDHPQLVYCFMLLLLLAVTIILDLKYFMLRDKSVCTGATKPYSWARVQLAWWTVIICSAFFSIMLTKNVIPEFTTSTLLLLGISAGTMASGQIIDQSDQNNPAVVRSQDWPTENFLLDILSDGNGVTIHRFQAVMFNLGFGFWVIASVWHNITLCDYVLPVANCADLVNATHTALKYSFIIPDLTQNDLVLLGISSATYAALKVGENKNNSISNNNNNAQVAGNSTPPVTPPAPVPSPNPQPPVAPVLPPVAPAAVVTPQPVVPDPSATAADTGTVITG